MSRFIGWFRALIFSSVLLLAVTTVQAQTSTGARSVRACRYVPGVSVPAVMPPDVVNAPTATPFPTPTLPAPAKVSADQKAQQKQVFQALWNDVNTHYVYPDFLGHDWKAIGDRYKALIENGLSMDEFYAAMEAMINELGDDHSSFQSPDDVKAEQDEINSQYNYVGIGTLSVPVEGTDGEEATVISVFPGSPAEKAGLLPHDTLLKINGGPLRSGTNSNTSGEVGTTLTLTVQRPGEQPHDVTLKREEITGMLPIDYCLVPKTHIGYIFLPTFLDDTITGQVSNAIWAMYNQVGPLDGLIIDNRENGGGLASVAEPIMGFFSSGLQGYFISRDDKRPLTLNVQKIGNSQTVPLIILVGRDTVSYGELFSGILHASGRARIVGETTLGNVEELNPYNFEDGSRAWIASATFQPLGQPNGIWETTGIIPDVVVPSRWDLFTEATDPALARAVALLMPPV